MADALTFHTLAFATPSLGDDQLSEPFAVLYTGKFRHGGREIPVTEADLDHAVDLFKRTQGQGYEPSIDWEHSFANGGTSKAAGWIKELWREGKKLMARAKWTPEARAQIASEEYRFLSPEFSSDVADEYGKGQGFGIVAAGLTNRPHLRALGAVALSQEARDLLGEDLSLDGIREAFRAELEALGFTPDRVESEGRKTAHMADENTVTLTEDQHKQLVDSAAKVEALTEKLGEQDARIEALSETVEAHKTRADTLDTELRTERLAACLSQARREGRIDASDEVTEKWAARADKLGLDTVKELLQELPAETIPMSERGHGADKPAAAETPAGVDEKAHRAHLRAEEIAAEKNISYEDAASVAFKEVYA